MSNLLLHEENLLRVPFKGKRLAADLGRRAQEVLDAARAVPIARDFGVSVIIRTKNDAANMGPLMEDIRANQEYFLGPVQVVLVDTESSDDTLAIARRYDKFFEVTVVPITQAEFTYPKSLNMGFEAARHPFVLTLVGHSRLSNKATLAVARKYAGLPDVAGGFCFGLPNSNATLAEMLGSAFVNPGRMIARQPRLQTTGRAGLMSANASMVRREVWEKLGGYDERYAAGGEDSELGDRMLAAGYKIFVEPVLAVQHTHGLGFWGNVRQFFYWRKLGKPLPFKPEELARYRDDLGLDS